MKEEKEECGGKKEKEVAVSIAGTCDLRGYFKSSVSEKEYACDTSLSASRLSSSCILVPACG